MARFNGYEVVDRAGMDRQQREYERVKEREYEESLNEDEDDPHGEECIFLDECAEYGRRCRRCR